ncbi:MAG: ABC transporter substrate-binding protein, partial [Desulfobacteraceae bacterium]
MAFVFAADKGHFSTRPITNNGKKWRIGYYEAGEYINYQKTLIATVKGLMEMGWIEKAKIPAQKGIQTGDLWKWLTLN